MSRAIGIAFIELSKLVNRAKPDLILSGFDIAANFVISVVGAHMNIPVAHIQGGELLVQLMNPKTCNVKIFKLSFHSKS